MLGNNNKEATPAPLDWQITHKEKYLEPSSSVYKDGIEECDFYDDELGEEWEDESSYFSCSLQISDKNATDVDSDSA